MAPRSVETATGEEQYAPYTQPWHEAEDEPMQPQQMAPVWRWKPAETAEEQPMQPRQRDQATQLCWIEAKPVTTTVGTQTEPLGDPSRGRSGGRDPPSSSSCGTAVSRRRANIGSWAGEVQTHVEAMQGPAPVPRAKCAARVGPAAAVAYSSADEQVISSMEHLRKAVGVMKCLTTAELKSYVARHYETFRCPAGCRGMPDTRGSSQYYLRVVCLQCNKVLGRIKLPDGRVVT